MTFGRKSPASVLEKKRPKRDAVMQKMSSVLCIWVPQAAGGGVGRGGIEKLTLAGGG